MEKIDFTKDTYSNATSVIGCGDYFVSAIDGNSYSLLAGPYESQKLAADMVDVVKKLCYKHDSSGRAVFKSYGTCRKPVDSGCIGSLNRLL